MELDALIAQLEGEFAALERGEHSELVAQLTEAELAQTSLKDRLYASVGHDVTVVGTAGTSITGTVERVGSNWFVLATVMGQEVINVDLCSMIFPLSTATGVAPSIVEQRLTFAHILRTLARRRVRVAVSVGAQSLVGYLAVVRQDHLDLAGVANPAGVVSLPLKQIFSIRGLN